MIRIGLSGASSGLISGVEASRPIALKSAVTLIALAMAALSSRAVQAQSVSSSESGRVQSFDTTDIRAETLPICTLVSQVSGPSIVDLTTNAVQSVGVLVYTCNNIDGFSRTISSLNGGALVQGSSRIPYTFSHGGPAALPLGPTVLTAPIAAHIAPFASITVGETAPVSVAVSGSTVGLLAGSYEDVVTVAISAD